MSESSPLENSSQDGGDLADLEFPVDPHFDSPPPTMTFAEYCEWCEQMRRAFKDLPASRPEDQCTVEFVL